MWLIETDFATAAENLAFDEALVEAADGRPVDTSRSVKSVEPAGYEVLRLWEMKETVVILGRGSSLSEAHQDACRRDGVPILRRCSGGASVVGGPGCLMYSLLLSLRDRPELRDLHQAHRLVMNTVAAAVRRLEPTVALDGTCDLTLGGRKCSGNAVRYKRDWILYHGTLLYAFPIDSVSRYLAMPPRRPEYRRDRAHADFLTNLGCSSSQLRTALAEAWSAELTHGHPWRSLFEATQARLLKAKYT